MADVPDVLTKARELGAALAAHPRVRAHLDAQRAVRADATAQQILRDYQAQMDQIQQREASHQPIEVADKHKLRELEQRLAGNESLKNLMRTQADYVALMNQVNDAIDAPLTELHAPETPA
ncbi:MAG: YlbF family regulator [Planctomycetota bacterium]